MTIRKQKQSLEVLGFVLNYISYGAQRVAQILTVSFFQLVAWHQILSSLGLCPAQSSSQVSGPWIKYKVLSNNSFQYLFVLL
jgi:ABC-type iron transport system FetAB permease component